jgi:hypothetical protein
MISHDNHSHDNHHVTATVILGVLVVALGVLLILGNLGIAHPVQRYWPVLLIGLGLARLLTPWRGSFLGGLLLVLGSLLLLRNLGIVHGGIGRYWPLLFVIIGIGMIRTAILGRPPRRRWIRCRDRRLRGRWENPQGPENGPGPSGRAPRGPEGASAAPMDLHREPAPARTGRSTDEPRGILQLTRELAPEVFLDAFARRCALALPTPQLY